MVFSFKELQEQDEGLGESIDVQIAERLGAPDGEDGSPSILALRIEKIDCRVSWRSGWRRWKNPARSCSGTSFSDLGIGEVHHSESKSSHPSRHVAAYRSEVEGSRR
jgi:hypothetical protein